MKNSIQKLLIFTAFIFIGQGIFAQSTNCCARYAVLKNCTINDPMKDNKYNDAYCKSIKSRLVELMTRTNCFHFLNLEMKQILTRGESNFKQATNFPVNEYSFEMDYISGLEGRNDQGKPVVSRMTISMYFEGEQRELVHRWQTFGTWDTVSNTGTSWNGHGNKLENNYADGSDIIEIMDRFEKKPQTCTFKPEKEILNPNELIDIELSDFRDLNNNTSREFNRIIVRANSGEIVNGEACSMGTDYKAFKVSGGNISLTYKAPENCENPIDYISIYNSCDVLSLSKVPLANSRIFELIIEKPIYLNCSDATLTIRKTANKIIRSENEEDKYSGNCKTHIENNHTLDETIEASVVLQLEKRESMDMPIFNQTWEYFYPLSVNLSQFNFTSNELRFDSRKHSGTGCAGGGTETTESFRRDLKDYKIEGKEYLQQFPWIIVYDNESGKAVKFIPGGYDISYELNEKKMLTSVVLSDQGKKTDTKHTQKALNKTFKFGPVGEEIPDPTIKKNENWMQDYLKRQGVELPPGVQIPNVSNEETIEKIQPDILVTTGDGKNNFGGHGQRTIRKDIAHGYQEEKLSYSWQISIKKE